MELNKTDYKRLGDYIREVDVRNRDFKVTKLVGLTIDKAFIPSVANVIGTDLSNYKVIRKKQFACSLMQVSRDQKMPVAMFKEDEAIMSPAYPMFEVINENVLLPEYLMMWFTRKEFDREASFYAVGGVRGSLTWEDFMDMTLPIPPIARQREIVSEYETLSRRIDLNNKMISRLEETAQTLYRKMFVDGIDKENLPDGWRMGTLGEVIKETIGGDWGKDKLIDNYNVCVYCIRGTDIPNLNIGYISMPKRFILNKNIIGRKLNPDDIIIEISGGSPTQSTGRTLLITHNICNYVSNDMICSNFCRIIRANKDYAIFVNATIKNLYDSGFLFTLENSSNGVKNLDLDTLLNIHQIVIPNTKQIQRYNKYFKTINTNRFRFCIENQKLKDLQSILLIKMGQNRN